MNIRCFGKLSALGPILGYFRGQPVYPRANVHKLASEERWLRQGRVIRSGEAPYSMCMCFRMNIVYFSINFDFHPYFTVFTASSRKRIDGSQEDVPMFGMYL